MRKHAFVVADTSGHALVNCLNEETMIFDDVGGGRRARVIAMLRSEFERGVCDVGERTPKVKVNFDGIVYCDGQ